MTVRGSRPRKPDDESGAVGWVAELRDWLRHLFNTKTNMKTILIILLLMFIVMGASAAVIYQADYTRQGGLVIPDGNPSGVIIHAPVNGVPAGLALAGVTVTLKISGGYNGDLVARLTAPNGATRTLMAQPGVTPDHEFGQSGKSLNITFSDAAPQSIQDQNGSGSLNGSYRAAEILGTLGLVSSASANGTWALFITDLASGGGTSHLNSWKLEFKLKAPLVKPALAVLAAPSK